MLLARRTFLLLALLASALIAGFFYTYSISVMPGLLATDSISAVRAMQGINATIRTPVFAFAFFGALVFPLLAALFSRERTQIALLAAAMVGLPAAWDANPRACAWIALACLSTWLAHSLLYFELRHRFALEPLLAVLAAPVLARLVPWDAKRSRC